MEQQASPNSYAPETGPRPFREVAGLWLQLFEMNQEFFDREAPRASGANTLISVVIAALVGAVISGLSVLLSPGMPADTAALPPALAAYMRNARLTLYDKAQQIYLEERS